MAVLSFDFLVPRSRSGRAINWDLIRQQYDQMVKYATALRLEEFEQINLVILPNGDKLPFRMIASGAPVDQGRDIAILKVNIKNSPFLKLADSKRVELLDHITVVGYPGAADNSLLASPGKAEGRRQEAEGMSPVLCPRLKGVRV